MQNPEVEFFLIHVESSQADILFMDLFLSGIKLELLDPRELGPKWQNVHFVGGKTDQTNPENVVKLRQINQVISKFDDQHSFEQNQESGDITKILENWQEKYLLDAVHRLNSNSIIDKKFLQQKAILKKQKNKWQVTIIKDLKALYTKYETTSKLSLVYSKLFKTDKNSNVLFACFATASEGSDKAVEILDKNQIDFEKIGWTNQISNLQESRELAYNIPSASINPRLLKLLALCYYLLCSMVLHDAFVGLVIVVISLLAYRYNLKSKVFLTQIWTGLGGIIIGIISGSFGGNMLQVLSMSKFLVVKEVSASLLNFMSLFQIVDWTNQNQNLLLNYNLSLQNITPQRLLVICFIAIALAVVNIVQLYRVVQDYNRNLPKLAIVRSIFILTLISLILTLTSVIPLWPSIVLLLGLYLYQPDLQFTTKFKTLIMGEFGIVGFACLFLKFLWFGAVFGVLVCSSLIFNIINNLIGDSVFMMVFANLLISIFLWQLTAFIVAKTLRENLTEQLSVNSDPNAKRTLKPVIKYKYWKL
jgi:hypothetical protein